MLLKEEVLKFIKDNFIFDEGEKLDENDSLLEKGIIDSTGVLELVSFIEEKYKITVEDDELVPENLDSINRIATFVSKKLKALQS